jgi:hypothetical protein
LLGSPAAWLLLLLLLLLLLGCCHAARESALKLPGASDGHVCLLLCWC